MSLSRYRSRLARAGVRRLPVEALEGRVLLSATPYQASLVNWWRDYIRNNDTTGLEVGDRRLSSHTPERDQTIDVDGDGEITDDEALYYPFSMTKELSPNGPDGPFGPNAAWGYFSDQPSARFFGGFAAKFGNFRPDYFDQASVEGDEGADPLTPDDTWPSGLRRNADLHRPTHYSTLNIFPYDGPYTTWPDEGPDDLVSFAGVFLWKKENFLNGGDSAQFIQLNSDSRLKLDVTYDWAGIGEARWVVQDGANFFVSQATIDNGGNAHGKTNTLDPTSTLWAPYTPSGTDYNSINFDQTQTFTAHTFTDLRSFGFYIEQDTLAHYPQVIFSIDNVNLGATVVPFPDNVFAFASANTVASELAGTSTITVTRQNPSGAASIHYSTSSGTATAGADFTTTSGVLDFAEGETSKTFTVTIIDDALVEGSETATLTLDNPTNGVVINATATLTINDGPNERGTIAVGPAAGGGGQVRVFNSETLALVRTITPYGAGYNSGIRVAVGDVNGDGIYDVVTAPVSGIATAVNAYNGVNGKLIFSFYPLGRSFKGGASIALGNFNGDAFADIVVGSGPGMSNVARVFSGKNRKAFATVQPYGSTYTGGVNVAAGDTDGVGRSYLVTAPMTGDPLVVVYNLTFNPQRQFRLSTTQRGGVNLATADTDNDSYDEVIATPASKTGGPVWVYKFGSQTALLSPYPASFRGGVSVAGGDLNGDGIDEILFAPASGNGAGTTTQPYVKVWGGTPIVLEASFLAFAKTMKKGFFVAVNH